jgi:hypothetical protein
MAQRFRLTRFLIPLLVVLALGVSLAVPAKAVDYAGAISAFRRAHGLPAVKSDSLLDAVALNQARAMAASGSVSHSVGGSCASIAPPRTSARGFSPSPRC